MNPLLSTVVAGVLVLDQFSKWLIRTTFLFGESRPVIEDVFHLTYYHNSGMAFGLMQGFSGWIAAFSVLAIGFLVYLHRKFEKEKTATKIVTVSLGLIIGGACGNLVDRLVLSGVVDFLDFGLGDYRWPAFNVADVCISTGVGLLVLFSARIPESPESGA